MSTRAAAHPADRRARRRRRRRAHRLDHRRGGERRPAGAEHFDSGVAQRTGATTYYIEIFPWPWRELGGKRPIMALSPGIGDVDIVVASELLEAARTVAAGFVTPDRTLAIASTHRSHAIAEKMAMGDGRLDVAKLAGEVTKNAREAILFDMEAAARSAGAMINAVMLGAIAGIGPPADAGRGLRGRDPRRRQGGRSQSARLCGGPCRRPRACARARLAARRQNPTPRAPKASPTSKPGGSLSPAPPTSSSKGCAGSPPGRTWPTPGSTSSACSRSLACRTRATSACCARPRAISRCACPMRTSSASPKRRSHRRVSPGIVAKMSGKPGEPVAIFEFLKPGIEEFCQLLPPRLAISILVPCATPRLDRAFPLGDGGASPPPSPSISGSCCSRSSSRFRRQYLPFPRGADGDRSLARPDRRGGSEIDRARVRNRGMRAADQGLWRHLEARRRELCHDRDAASSDPVMAGRHDGARGHRRHRERAHRRARRPRGRRRWRAASPRSSRSSDLGIAAE